MMRARNVVAFLVIVGAAMLGVASAAAASSCDRQGLKTVQRMGGGVIMLSRGKKMYVCSPTYGIRVYGGTFPDGEFEMADWGLEAIRGKYATWSDVFLGGEDGPQVQGVRRANLATGRRENELFVRVARPDENVRALALATDGSIGWIIDYTNDEGTVQARTVHVWRPGAKQREVARGWVIRPRYLAFALGVSNKDLTYAKVRRAGWPDDQM